MGKHTGWWYCAEFGVFGGIRYIDETPDGYRPQAWLGNIWGPFRTFGEAKRDALEYFRSDIEHTRGAIREVKATKRNKGEE